jgi:hypothetical protein
MLGAELEHGLAALKVAVESDTTTAASSSARAAN